MKHNWPLIYAGTCTGGELRQRNPPKYELATTYQHKGKTVELYHYWIRDPDHVPPAFPEEALQQWKITAIEKDLGIKFKKPKF